MPLISDDMEKNDRIKENEDIYDFNNAAEEEIAFEAAWKTSEITEQHKSERGKVLGKALTIINGERLDQYGSPEDSFALIASYWSTYLKKEISSKDVALLMVLFKIAREANQHKEDNIVDAAGYLGILGDL